MKERTWRSALLRCCLIFARYGGPAVGFFIPYYYVHYFEFSDDEDTDGRQNRE